MNREDHKRVGDMFNERVRYERIGHLHKTNFIHELREVEEYFLELSEEYNIKTSYDVVANEAMSFKTLGYTEWAGNFLIFPLQNEIRQDSIIDCLHSPEPCQDWVSYYKKVLEDKNANKYEKRLEPSREPKDNIVVLVGTNKLKSSIDIDKLVWLSKTKKGNILFKPHPLTTNEYIGLLMDKLGEENILKRDEDLYFYIQNSKKVYTTHFSESLLFASVLGKETEPIDLYRSRQTGGFFHINNMLFKNQFNSHNLDVINKVLSCSRSGVINPRVDSNWKEKMEAYMIWAADTREKYKVWYAQDINKDNDKRRK